MARTSKARMSPGSELADYLCDESARSALRIAIDANIREQMRAGHVSVRGTLDYGPLISAVIEIMTEHQISRRPWSEIERG